MDVFKGYKYFPMSSKPTNDSFGCMRLSCMMRAFQGYLATLTVFLVVITSETVVDIILNFAALNFISGLDDEAYSLIQSGMFGAELQKEAKRIEEVKLPSCVRRKSKVVLYWSVMGSTVAILFSLLIVAMLFQDSPKEWITQNFRVHFRDRLDLKNYNGCYKIDKTSKLIHRRRIYNSLQQGTKKASFGYCNKQRQWIFFKDTKEALRDPCKASDAVIAKSTETNDFDIAKSFEESWFYRSSSVPLDLHFETDEDELHCDKFLGDGICDKEFNNESFKYDDGDCCAATCTQSGCGYEGLKHVFGIPNITGLGYPNCIEDNYNHPITIQLNDVKSSRHAEYSKYDPCAEDALNSVGEDEWRKTTPVSPKLMLECNGRIVLSVDIEESMANESETVFVEDKANCTLTITNSTSIYLPDVEDGMKSGHDFDFNWICREPILFVDYTILHGNANATHMKPIEVLTHSSEKKKEISFGRMPQCYVDKLEDYMDITSIYNNISPSSEAAYWLREDGFIEGCESSFFLERYALAAMIFAMDGNIFWLDSNNFQCNWPGITCSSLGNVTQLDLPKANLAGSIPSEFKILSSLKQLYLCK
jgi:hypothetical protein